MRLEQLDISRFVCQGGWHQSSIVQRRDPYPVYDRLRASAPLIRDPASGLWLALGYDVVKQVLSSSDVFSSRYGPDWMIFADPPPAHKAAGSGQ